MSFSVAYSQLSGLEGGYSDDPNDPGNWTGGEINSGELRGSQCGISAKAYPTLDIKSLTPSQVRAIYLRDYWDKISCDLLPDVVAVALFKEAVNIGVSGAVRAFQRSLKIDADGVMGQVTIGNATSHPPILVLQGFLTQVGYDYTQMRDWDKYGKGWISRVIRTALEAQLTGTELAPNSVKG